MKNRLAVPSSILALLSTLFLGFSGVGIIATPAQAVESNYAADKFYNPGIFDDFGNAYVVRSGSDIWGNGGLTLVKIPAARDGSGNPTGLAGTPEILYAEQESNRLPSGTCASLPDSGGSVGENGCKGPKAPVGMSETNTNANWVTFGGGIAWSDSHTLLIGDANYSKLYKFDLITKVFWTYIDNTVINPANYGKANSDAWYKDIVGAPKFRFIVATNDGIPVTFSAGKLFRFDETEPTKFKSLLTVDPLDGAPTTAWNGAGPPSSTWCASVYSITIDPSDNVYLGCANLSADNYDSVVKLTPTISGGVTTYSKSLFGLLPTFNSWVTITSDARGQIFVGSGNLNDSFLIANGVVTSSPLDQTPGWVMFDRAGNLYYTWNYNIRKSPGLGYPYPPRGVNVAGLKQSAQVTWLSPGVTGIETYTVVSNPVNPALDATGTKTCQSVKQSGALTPSFSCTVSGLINGVQYSISMYATTARGDSLPTSTYLVTPSDIPDAPAVTSVVLSGNTSGRVSFTAPASDGGLTIESYTVTSTPDSVTAYVTGSGSGSAILTGLRPGITYSFGVQAGNANGLSAFSNGLTLKIPKSPVFSSWSNISKTKADVPFALVPPVESYTAAGTFTYTSSNPGIISITDETATVVQSGSAVITATFYPTDTATYLSGVTKTMTISVSAQSNVITFGSLATRALTAGSFNLGATVTGGTVTYTTSAAASICTVTSAGLVSLFAPGSCSITASSVGNAIYGPADSVVQALTITAAAPGAPTLTSVSVGGTDVTTATSGYATLAFSANTENGGSITSYTLSATPISGSAITSTVTAAAGSRSGTITGLTLGTSYTYSVTAYNGGTTGGGNSLSSNTLAKTPAANPQAPTNLRVTSGNTTLTANWTAPTNLGGGTWGSYRIFIKESSDASFPSDPIATDNTQATSSYTFTGLTNGVAYDVKIWVQTTVSGSLTTELESNTAAVYLIPATIPVAPRIALSQIDSTTVSASWASNGDGGSALTGYTIALSSGACAFTFVSGTTSYTCSVTGVTPGATITATAIALNGVGSSVMTTSNALTYVSRVGAPISLVSTDNDGGASIAFTSVANGESIASYDYSLDGISFSPAASATSPVVITGLTNGTSYSIYLRAKGAIYGDGPVSASVVVLPHLPVSVASVIISSEKAPYFKVISAPKISMVSEAVVCSAGVYKFMRNGLDEEDSKLSLQIFTLISNGVAFESIKDLTGSASFTLTEALQGATLSCQVEIEQEGIAAKFTSLDKSAMASLRDAELASLADSLAIYKTERDVAYAQRIDGDTASYLKWKSAFTAAFAKRTQAREKASSDRLASLAKAGISILVEKPKPVKEVVVPVNVQPTVLMKKIGTIYFASGTYFLNSASKKALDSLAVKIASAEPLAVLSYGHTDRRGGVDNSLLSQNRAKAIAKYLRVLLPGQKIVTGWYAATKPISTGTSAADLAKNRRVEIFVK